MQAATEAVLADAEALGIDAEAIREGAIATEGLTDAEHHAEVQRAIKGAITQARADAARRDAGADQASKRDRGASADTQGHEGAAPERLTLEVQDAQSLREKTAREATERETRALMYTSRAPLGVYAAALISYACAQQARRCDPTQLPVHPGREVDG